MSVGLVTTKPIGAISWSTGTVTGLDFEGTRAYVVAPASECIAPSEAAAANAAFSTAPAGEVVIAFSADESSCRAGERWSRETSR